MSCKFEDYSFKVKDALKDTSIGFLEEAGGELESQVKRNSRVDTGQTKGSWQHVTDESGLECSIGSNLENAIWEEFGTGMYAVKGNGRKSPWMYKDSHGQWHKTRGKKPSRAFHKAYVTMKNKIQRMAEKAFGDLK